MPKYGKYKGEYIDIEKHPNLEVENIIDIPWLIRPRSCPFCRNSGYEALILTDDYLTSNDKEIWQTTCHNCGASGPTEDTPEEAFFAWSTSQYQPKSECPVCKENKVVKHYKSLGEDMCRDCFKKQKGRK